MIDQARTKTLTALEHFGITGYVASLVCDAVTTVGLSLYRDGYRDGLVAAAKTCEDHRESLLGSALRAAAASGRAKES